MVQRWYAWLLFCRVKPMFAQFVSWLLASLVHYLVRDTALVQGGYAQHFFGCALVYSQGSCLCLHGIIFGLCR